MTLELCDAPAHHHEQLGASHSEILYQIIAEARAARSEPGRTCPPPQTRVPVPHPARGHLPYRALIASVRPAAMSLPCPNNLDILLIMPVQKR